MASCNDDDVPLLNENPDEPLVLNSPSASTSTREISQPAVDDNEDDDEPVKNQKNQEAPNNCYDRFCFNKLRTKIDFVLLGLHLVNFVLVGSLVALILKHRQATKGLCLTAASILDGGVVEYSINVTWCNLLLYACIVSATMSWVSIVVKWTAQAYGSIRWLKVEFTGNVLALMIVLCVFVAQMVQFIRWCTSMDKAMMTYHGDYNKTTVLRCEQNTKDIDQTYPEIVKLHDAYVFTVIELTLSSLHFIMWCIIVYFAGERMKYQIRLRDEKETKMRRETFRNAVAEYQQMFREHRNPPAFEPEHSINSQMRVMENDSD